MTANVDRRAPIVLAALLTATRRCTYGIFGGWSGDPVPTLQSFIDAVRAGKISHYVEAGRGRSFEEKGHGEVIYGASRGASHTREIAESVAKHYSGTVIGESTVYRLT